MATSASSSATGPERVIRELLDQADVRIGGDRPQDIMVHDDSFYSQVLSQGELGLGESYMDGKWGANNVPAFIERIIRADLQSKVHMSWHTIVAYLQSIFINRQSVKRARTVAKEHYDLSGVLPDKLLDPYNQYTCAYFRDGNETLDQAQEKKLDLICRKLQLKKEDRVLDIGCGWGGFAKFAASRYGCHVTGISISEEQIKYAKKFCEGLPVDIKYCDYRDLTGTYDKILTCGMIEHVGSRNYAPLFRIAHDRLKDGGLYLLHTIGTNLTMKTVDAFVDKYIFPNGMLPTLTQLSEAWYKLFALHDFQNLGAHYGPTLLAWHKNFVRNWQSMADLYDERFRRMFEYYLLSFAGAFQAGGIQLWQFVLTKPGFVLDCRGVR